jgi:hypothetical protein
LMKLTACQAIILFCLERRGRRFHQTLLVKQKDAVTLPFSKNRCSILLTFWYFKSA